MPVRALRALVLVVVLLAMFFVCLVKVMRVSYVRPSILCSVLRGSALLLSLMCGCALCSLLPGVNSVMADFYGEAVSLFGVSPCSKVYR